MALDESGNTGQALLDGHQPVFVLASVYLNAEAAQRLAAIVGRPGSSEAKVKRLRRSAAGREMMLKMLNDPLVNPATVKLAIYHKPFMVTTKIVDVLIESLLYSRGIDLYEGGANLGLANMWHAVMPTFTSVEAFGELQRLFVEMCRRYSAQSINAFYAHVKAMRAINSHREFDNDLRMLEDTRLMVDEALDGVDKNLLDPHIPSFVDIASQWTAYFDRPFRAVNDPAKPLAQFRAELELLMSSGEKQVFSKLGPARQLPLQVQGIEFADSTSVPAIQVADVVAGAAATVCIAVATGAWDAFSTAAVDSRLRSVIEATERIWPSLAVTPDELDAENREGGAALQAAMEIAARERARKAGGV